MPLLVYKSYLNHGDLGGSNHLVVRFIDSAHGSGLIPNNSVAKVDAVSFS